MQNSLDFDEIFNDEIIKSLSKKIRNNWKVNLLFD